MMDAVVLRLTGGMQTDAAAGDYRLIAGMWDRLPREIPYLGEVTRFVAYESARGQQRLRFFGIEVERLSPTSPDLYSWELSEHQWTVRQGDAIIWQQPVQWQWLSPSANGRYTGEFSAPCPAAWCNDRVGDARRFHVTTNAYIGPNRQGANDDIYLVDYDPSWPQQFADFADWLRDILGPDHPWRIEHYGSTAIPGIPAKPILDVLLEVPSYAAAIPLLLPRLNSEAWEFWQYTDHPIFIKRDALMGCRTHHLHMAPAGHPIWQGLAFRDYLCAHPDEATRYAALKHELSTTHRSDREGYTHAKEAFVREIVAKAADG